MWVKKMSKEQFLEFISRIETMKVIIKLNDPEKYNDLVKKDKYWVPENRPSLYSEWVMQNYAYDLDDAVSLCVYSLLMNKPIKELKEEMNDGFELEGKKR